MYYPYMSLALEDTKTSSDGTQSSTAGKLTPTRSFGRINQPSTNLRHTLRRCRKFQQISAWL